MGNSAVAQQQMFISHSRGASTDFGKIFYDWIKASPLPLKPWASFAATDITSGPRDQEKIIEAALKSDLCVCLMSKDNLMHHWVNFEAGLFYGKRSDVYPAIYTILIDGLEPTDFTGGVTDTHPLSQITHCVLSKGKESLRTLLRTLYINHSQYEGTTDNIPEDIAKIIDLFIDSKHTRKLLKSANKKTSAKPKTV